jgi:hypothetical protein
MDQSSNKQGNSSRKELKMESYDSTLSCLAEPRLSETQFLGAHVCVCSSHNITRSGWFLFFAPESSRVCPVGTLGRLHYSTCTTYEHMNIYMMYCSSSRAEWDSVGTFWSSCNKLYISEKSFVEAFEHSKVLA